MLLLFLARAALAGDYTLGQLVTAAQRGMSEDTIETLAQQGGPWSVAPEDVVPLLRSGLSPQVIAILTSGAHPTGDELAAAKQPGPGYTAPPAPVATVEYRQLDDAAWSRQRGASVSIRVLDGSTAEGVVKGVTSTQVILDLPDGSVQPIAREDVVAVRRADGKPIVSGEFVQEVEKEEHQTDWGRVAGAKTRSEKLHAAGGSLLLAGVLSGSAGALGLVLGHAQAVHGDYTGAAAWSYLGYSGLTVGVPMLVTGIVLNSIAD